MFLKGEIFVMPQPTILLWNLPVFSEVVSTLSSHPNTQHLSLRFVSPQESNQTLRQLAGLVDSKSTNDPCSCPSAPCMVFCGLSEEELDTCLAVLRQCSQKVPLKAVLTPHNQNWNFSKLFAELMEEHQYFQQQQNKNN